MKKNLFFAISLITVAVLFRTLWHLAPNVEFITAATFLAGRYLGRRYSIVVPFAAMVISDFIIGNTSIYLFTWTAYLVIGLMAIAFNTTSKRSSIAATTGMGVSAGVWFYLWTNFGVWALDSWGMYPRTFQGLIHCYIMGLPFLKYTLLGNTIFIPVTFGLVRLTQKIIPVSFWQLKLTR